MWIWTDSVCVCVCACTYVCFVCIFPPLMTFLGKHLPLMQNDSAQPWTVCLKTGKKAQISSQGLYLWWNTRSRHTNSLSAADPAVIGIMAWPRLTFDPQTELDVGKQQGANPLTGEERNRALMRLITYGGPVGETLNILARSVLTMYHILLHLASL